MSPISPGVDTQEATGRATSREPILRAAVELIARSGVRGLRVEEVAARAGVSTGLLYYHFASRTGLVRAALDYGNEHAPSVKLGDAGQDECGYQAVLAALLAELDDDPAIRISNIVWNEARTTAVFDPDLRPDMDRLTRIWEDAVATGISRGIADGSIAHDVDPVRSARILTSLADGMTARWLARTMTLEEARAVLRTAVDRVLGPRVC